MVKKIIYHFALFLALINAEFRFTNLRCTSLDTDFDDFEYCFFKAVNRTYSYMSLKVKLYKVPITKVSVQIALLKRANGFKPFLYNVTFDACKFLKNPNGKPVAKYLFTLFGNHSNMYHTCPFNHDLILDKLDTQFLDNRLTNILPLPRGEYALDTKWIAYKKNRANVVLYFELK